MRKSILISYSLFLLFITFFSYFYIDKNLIYFQKIYSGIVTQNRLVTSIIFSLILIIFFTFYLYFLRLAKSNKINIRSIKYLIGLNTLFLLLSYPAMLSYDVFNYVATAKVFFFYGENPYIIMPINFIGDPLLLFTHAANKVALYGPSWIMLSGVPYLLSFDNFILFLFNLKVLAVLGYIGVNIIIWKTTRSILSLGLFALNPLVIIETLISGHNDIIMMFFALFSFFLLTKKKILLSIFFLVISILIKYATIFLLPVFVYVLFEIVRKKNVGWEKIFYLSFLLMFIIFLLSPIREEIYSWYTIWFLTFSLLVPRLKAIIYISIALAFGLLLRYIPYMLLGTYSGPTQPLKTLLTFLPVLTVLIYILVFRKLWLKELFRFY